MQVNKIYEGNSLEVLKTFPDESIDCVITSPPFFALRKYGDYTQIWGGDTDCEHEFKTVDVKNQSGGGSPKQNANAGSHFESSSDRCVKCGAWRGQLGLEPTYQEFIEHLLLIFDEVKRILKPEGTCWVNLGDSYMSNSSYSVSGRQGFNQKDGMMHKKDAVIKQKSLMMIPERFAIGMVGRGWILRNEIIWHKPNAMPESVRDRFTKSHEKIYFFTKNKKYYFEKQYEPYSKNTKVENYKGKGVKNYEGNNIQNPSDTKRRIIESIKKNKGRNKRDVWSITTKGFKGAHFATFPPELPETCIKAGCPEDGVVLDMFFGSGTTGVVANKLGRNFIGIEQSPEYIKIAEDRFAEELGMFNNLANRTRVNN